MQIETLLETPGLTDLVYNGRHGFALVSGVWRRIEDAPSEQEVAKLAIELCDRGGRHLDLANPFADVSLQGMRVHAVLPAGVSELPLLSVRKHATQTFEVSAELQELVSRKANILVTGATGAGKTTLLRSLFHQLDERVLTIEDVAELGFEKPNFVSLVARQANIEGKGEVSVERLFREALRMRPDRIVLGEIRGTEFGLMLQALNTGHAGSAATLHANSLDSVASRLIGLGYLCGLNQQATRQLTLTAIDVVVHLDGGLPQIANLSELL